MKKINLYEANGFGEKTFKSLLVHDSPYFKILNFNFRPSQELPVHAHDIEGEASLTALGVRVSSWERTVQPSRQRLVDVLISAISEPHGLRAKTDLRLLVTTVRLIFTRVQL